MSSERKLQEAEFFIELLDALEERGEALTNIDDPCLEASFLFSAATNALYSAVEMMKHERIDTKAFRAQHPEVYAVGSKGGERAITVHIAHTEPSSEGSIPVPADQVNFYFRPGPRLVASTEKGAGRADFRLRKPFNVLITLRSRQMSMLEFCQEQLGYLQRFYRESVEKRESG